MRYATVNVRSSKAALKCHTMRRAFERRAVP